MHALSLLVIIAVIFVQARARCTLTTPLSSSNIIPLNDGSATLSVPISLCTDISTTPLLVQSSLPSTLNPTLSLSEIQNDTCKHFIATLDFSSGPGTGTVTLTHLSCSLALKVTITGVTAILLPSRSQLTAPSAPPLTLNPPRTKFSQATTHPIAVSILLPSGEFLHGRRAAEAIQARLNPPVSGLVARLGAPGIQGNLVLGIEFDGSDKPREPFQSRLELITSSGESAKVELKISAVRPVVHEVRASPVQPNAGGGSMSILVSRGAGIRRLVLQVANERLRISESHYVEEKGFIVATFELPELGQEVIGRVGWKLEVLFEGKVWEARDATGFELIFAWKPVLSAVFPATVASGSRGMLSLSGRFMKQSVEGVQVGEKEVLSKSLLFVGDNEIRLQVPPLKKKDKREEVLIVVRDSSGLESDGMRLVLDPGALEIGVMVSGASYNARTGYSEVTSICGDASPIVQVNLDRNKTLYKDSTFRFLIRTSEMKGTDFEEIGSGSNDAIRIVSDGGIFRGDPEFADEVITVLVRATVAGKVGEAVIFISRWVRQDRIGVSVLSLGTGPLQHSLYPGESLQAYVDPFQLCGGTRDLEISTEWSVNGEIVETRNDGSMDDREADEGHGVLYGLGSRVFLPNRMPATYQFSVQAREKSSGKLYALGMHSGTKNGEVSDGMKIHAVLNGGAEHVSVPVDNDFSLKCDVLNGVNASLMYQWACVNRSGENSVCDEGLFPADLTDSVSKISRLSVSAGASFVGQTIEYSVRVSTSVHESYKVPIMVSFVGEGNVLFPPTRIQTGTAPVPAIPNSSTHLFQSYDDVVLHMGGPPQFSVEFLLLRHKNAGDWEQIDLADKSNILISHNGYWSPRSKMEPFFGLDGRNLQPGLYRLHGAVESRGNGGRTSWSFTKAPAAAVILFEPPVRVGIANTTTFHASAVSSPTSDNLFFFSLEAIDREGAWDHNPESRLISQNCLGTCSGHGRVSFTVRSEGRFVVVVDMFDPTGTRHIASSKTTSYIIVQPPQIPGREYNDSKELQRQLDAAIKRGDEGEFIDILSNIPHGQFLTGTLLRQSLRGLRAISTSPFRNPIQIARMLTSCTSVMNQESVDMKAALQLISIAENSIAQIPTFAPYGGIVARDLGRFYGTVSDKMAILDEQSSEDGEGGWSGAMEIGQSAFRNIILVLSSGLECGATRRVSVPRRNMPTRNGSDGDQYFDDYRVGISCYAGQVKSLSPEPFLSQLCPGVVEDKSRLNGNVSIMASVERHEMFGTNKSRDTVKGPVVFTSFLRREGNGRVTMVNIDAGGEVEGVCVETRVSVFVNRSRIGNERLFSEEGSLRCANAGKVFMWDSSRQGGERREETVSEFGFHADGRVSAVVKTKIAASTHMEVNMTLLQVCSRDVSIAGEGGSNLGLILSVVGGLVVAAVVCAVIVGYATSCLHKFENFSVPAEVAPRHSFSASGDLTQSTSGSLALNGGGSVILGVRDDWEGEYARLSGTEENLSSGDGGSIQQVKAGLAVMRDRLESVEGDMDDFASRGGLSSFRRTSLSEARTDIQWHGLRERSSDSSGSESLSGKSSGYFDIYVPDIYVRGVILEEEEEEEG